MDARRGCSRPSTLLTDSSVVLPKQDRGGVSGSAVSAEVDADSSPMLVRWIACDQPDPPHFAVRPERGDSRRASRPSACRMRSIRPLTVSPWASRSDHRKSATSSARRTARGCLSNASNCLAHQSPSYGGRHPGAQPSQGSSPRLAGKGSHDLGQHALFFP